MIKKVKDWLGIEGVKIVLDVKAPIKLKDTKLTGNALFRSKTEQFVDSLKLKLVEKYSRGRRKGKLIDEYVLGEGHISINQKIMPEEEMSISFELSYIYTKSPFESFGDRNYFYKGISWLAHLAKKANSEFYLMGEAKVKGTALDPYHRLPLEAI